MRYVGLDIEAYGQHIWSVTVYEQGKKPQTWHDCEGMKKCPPALKELLQDPTICKIIHNSEFDGFYFAYYWQVFTVNIWDTLECEKVIVGMDLPPVAKANRTPEMQRLYAEYGVALDLVLARYGLPVPDKSQRPNFIDRPLGMPFTKAELKYMVDDVVVLPALQKAQEFILKRDHLLEKALLENQVCERVIDMKYVGLGVDRIMWLEIADKNLQEYRRGIASLPRAVANWNSPAQVKEFFTQRGTKLDSYTELESVYIKTRDPILGRFIKVRQMYSDATSYGQTWLYRRDGSTTIDPDGRIRCNWIQQLNTGRFATNSPNVLALPKEGQQRSAIVPKKGHVFVIGDFSGQEIGIMAAASKERLWIDALLRGEDIHALMASIVSPGDWERATKKGCTFPLKCVCPGHKKLREPAKVNNFLLAYGGGADKLVANMTEAMFERPGMPTQDDLDSLPTQFEARVFVRKHKNVIRRLVAYLEANAKEAQRTQVSYSADPYRSRRVLRGEQDWQVANQGRNNPIQAAGANMLKLAMISMPKEFAIVLPFHDELVCEVPTKAGKRCAKAMKDIMEKSADYITGIKGLIKVEPRIATNFAKA